MKKIRRQTVILGLYALVMTIAYFQTVVGTYNTTVLAFSYRYGFLSRGFVGTCYQILDKLLPWDLYTYRWTQAFSFGLHLVFVLTLLFFFYTCLKKGNERLNHGMIACIFIFATFSFPEYVTFENMGRIDAVMAVLTILSVYLLLRERWEWLIIPISAIGICVHQGYALMFLSVPLVFLAVKVLENKNNTRKKYLWIFFLTCIISGILFMYFNYFSHTGGREIYEQVYKVAEAISADGAVHKQLIEHEILGLDPVADEWATHLFNFREILIFTIMMLPYLYLLIRFFSRCIKKAPTMKEKIKYMIMAAAGPVMIFPDFAFKIDYGRWVFCLIFYYAVVVLGMLARGDEALCDSFCHITGKVRKYPAIGIFLLLYPMLLTPLGDIWITELSKKITEVLLGVPQGAMIF